MYFQAVWNVLEIEFLGKNAWTFKNFWHVSEITLYQSGIVSLSSLPKTEYY